MCTKNEKVVVSDLRERFNKLSHEHSKGSCYDELVKDTLFSECFPDEVSEKIAFAYFFFLVSMAHKCTK